MTSRFQNDDDNNTDNQNTLNIPIPKNPPNYRQPNPNRRQQQSRPNQNYQSQQRQPQPRPIQNYQSQQRQPQPRPTQNYQYQVRQPQPRPVQQSRLPIQKNRKKHRHKSLFGKTIRKVIMTLFTILVVLFGVYSCTAFTIINKVGKQETGERSRTAGALSRSYVKSVLVIGTDGRSMEEQGRSDSMILLSFNSRSNKIILTSFMRDCYVNIAGYGMDKLNAAYSYGGAELLMDTIESNFNIKINDYVTVNFISFAGLIDAVGGIDIDVSADEAQEINNILFSEVNQLMGDDQWADFLEIIDGKIHLNGKQALSYARIRYVGNSDFERTSRQREVITKIIPKIINPVSVSRVAKNVIPQVNTNMSSLGMYLLSLKIPFSVGYDIEQIQIPAENTFYPEDVWCYDGTIQSVLQVDFDANHNILEDTVFDH
ncbi:MAG: LCP family protein [Ruminococcus sp.]|nr:LCP family protein [Ruminococcus sp.]